MASDGSTPLVWARLPDWWPAGGHAVACRILAKRGASSVVLDHEAVHVAQQRRDGWVRWLWRYVVSRGWRARYEAEAYAVQVRAGHSLDVMARRLAGPMYLWPCSVDEARRLIAAAV